VGIWFAVNLLFGIGVVSLTGGDESVAWQAHIGGFVAGLVLFAAFDPVSNSIAASQQSDAGPTPH
jgi:membrane associated rhomboid family serine protease